ncbi:hypothetical protein [Spirillospora sp. CA-294931]|uniref:hypothetical protein n=1 Tax=Spirillospora sp. CA-294931 TaxID=3240042 RepID=UPI003D8B56ED
MTQDDYFRKEIGELALTHKIEDGTWIAVRDAVILAGISSTQLRNWAKHGVISCFQAAPEEPRKYVQEELALIAELRKSQGGAPPHLFQIRRLIATRKAQAED